MKKLTIIFLLAGILMNILRTEAQQWNTLLGNTINTNEFLGALTGSTIHLWHKS